MSGESEFSNWLRGPAAKAFLELEKVTPAGGWPGSQRLEDVWATIDARTDLDPAAKARFRDLAALAFLRFEQVRAPKGGLIFGVSAFGFGVFCFMFMVVLILAGAVFESSWILTLPRPGEAVEPVLTRLSNIETARGLITFVFTIGVIALALIIVTANVTTEDGDGKRFERSKDILTTLIAILGTIMGFYFGKADVVEAQSDPARVAVVDEAPLDGANRPDASGGQGGDTPAAEPAAAAPDAPADEAAAPPSN